MITISNRTTLIVLGLALFAKPARTATFTGTPIAPDQRVEVINRKVTREWLGRDLFAAPYASVVVGTWDLYEVFPYLEARYFQVVSDPRWNRLLIGEVGGALAAFDGRGTAFGPLSAPRGLAVDAERRVYVCDTDNDRVLVFQVVSEFDRLELAPLFEVVGLSRPYGVAHSDAGTPFDPADDRLYVAETGKNRVARFWIREHQAAPAGTIGRLGSGVGCFAGPMAIAVGRLDGACTEDVYVADAHNRRIVHLKDQQGNLVWTGERRHEADLITSLDTDRWGNLYAASPSAGCVFKSSPTLEPVAELREGLRKPRSFHIPFVTVRDHGQGSRRRECVPSGLSIEEWGEESGLRLWRLGVEVREGTVEASLDHRLEARFRLTDQAGVAIEVRDRADGRLLAHRDAGVRAAGPQVIRLDATDFQAGGTSRADFPADCELIVTATSSYANGEVADARIPFSWDGRNGESGGATGPARLVGGSPNPFRLGRDPDTSIRFVAPSSGSARARLRFYHPDGRVVRSVTTGPLAAGPGALAWDGCDEGGRPVRSGIYFYRLELDDQCFTSKLVVIE